MGTASFQGSLRKTYTSSLLTVVGVDGINGQISFELTELVEYESLGADADIFYLEESVLTKGVRWGFKPLSRSCLKSVHSWDLHVYQLFHWAKVGFFKMQLERDLNTNTVIQSEIEGKYAFWITDAYSLIDTCMNWKILFELRKSHVNIVFILLLYRDLKLIQK